MSFIQFFWRAAKLWYHREADNYAAALAYFTPFALTPLIIFSITIVGFIVGVEQVTSMLLRWGNAIDPGVTDLLYRSVQNFDKFESLYYIPLIGLVFLSIMIFIALNSLTVGLHKIWGIEATGWNNFFKRLFRSTLFIIIFQAYLVFIILFEDTLEFLIKVTDWQWLSPVGFVMMFLSTMLLLTVAYGLLALKSPSFTGRFAGAAVACLLLLFSRELVALHFSTAPVQSLFGAAGLLISLLVWVYVSAVVILYGAACAKIYDGETHET